MTCWRIVLLPALALWATAAQAQQPVTVAELRTLLLAAIDAPDGKAQGLLVGDEAEAIARRFHGTSALHIEVTTLRRYAQAGCSRLNVRVRQYGVQLPGRQAPRTQTIDIGIDYCRDGQAPRLSQ